MLPKNICAKCETIPLIGFIPRKFVILDHNIHTVASMFGTMLRSRSRIIWVEAEPVSQYDAAQTSIPAPTAPAMTLILKIITTTVLEYIVEI
jgi:hypothetical protein